MASTMMTEWGRMSRHTHAHSFGQHLKRCLFCTVLRLGHAQQTMCGELLDFH
uniref:Uncharacterized protein n=1 Tax=Anguilla anguilla TaxID=7936 RepID=A0A0E9TLW5_ANGAN